MKMTKEDGYIRKRKFYRTFFGIFSLSGILFAFQACYGTPQDFGQDVRINGKVTSSINKAGIKDIKVMVNLSGVYVRTDADGSYQLWCERQDKYSLSFTDTDGMTNGQFTACDTLVTLPAESSELILNVELK